MRRPLLLLAIMALTCDALRLPLRRFVRLTGAPAPLRRSLRAPAVPPQVLEALAVNSGLAAAGSLAEQKSLTQAGLLHAYMLGLLLWSAGGWRAWSVCVLYLVAGSLVTKVGKAEKERLGIAEGRGGARGPENVWGSAATAALCALGLCVPTIVKTLGGATVLQLAFVASLATKLSDTFASEIGKAYGKSCFLITTLKPVKRGTEGAVSVEGTLAGVIGSVIIGVYAMKIGWVLTAKALYNVMISAFVATNVESLLGALIQGQNKWLTNESINFINTLVGAVCSVVLALGFGLL